VSRKIEFSFLGGFHDTHTCDVGQKAVRRRRGVESPAIVSSVTVVDIEVAEMGGGGPGAM
jgi:hypothetical protein